MMRSSNHTHLAQASHLSLRSRRMGWERSRWAPRAPRCTSSSSTAGRPRLRVCSSVSISRSGSRTHLTLPCDQTRSDMASSTASNMSAEPNEAARVRGVSPRLLRMLAPPCSSSACSILMSPCSTHTCTGVLPCAVNVRWRSRFLADSSASTAASATSACCDLVSSLRLRSADALTLRQWSGLALTGGLAGDCIGHFICEFSRDCTGDFGSQLWTTRASDP
mmetsp:Transcript_9129/g.30258  ORF Transcript_9129/g.30258 Transcript_9129/m.30258 type:complete len:221 (-) Transcript_9129:1034-1696(-)